MLIILIVPICVYLQLYEITLYHYIYVTYTKNCFFLFLKIVTFTITNETFLSVTQKLDGKT